MNASNSLFRSNILCQEIYPRWRLNVSQESNYHNIRRCTGWVYNSLFILRTLLPISSKHPQQSSKVTRHSRDTGQLPPSVVKLASLYLTMENLPVDYFLTSQAFTKAAHRDVHPTIDPASSSNSQAGKVIVITGASKGLGRIVGIDSVLLG